MPGSESVRARGPRALSLLLIATLLSCTSDREDFSPVVYVSVDPPIAQPILAASESIVHASYDTETNKTAGLVARLRAERAAPRADLFWNGEVARTIELCREGVLARSALANLIVATLISDPDGCWIGFAARARVFIVPSILPDKSRPQSILDLVNPHWRGKAAIANPHFGTTGTHFAALYATWGNERFRKFIRGMRANAVTILPGNAQVRDAITQGRFDWGLTDTDDVHGAMQDGAAVEAVFPDQYTELGLFLIPNTVALVAGGPHPEAGWQLAEYLTSASVEAKLAAARGAQIPIRHNVPGPAAWPDAASLHRMAVSFDAVADAFPAMLRAFDEEWPQ
jgi:iron(III) transport system substrate-binding protein